MVSVHHVYLHVVQVTVMLSVCMANSVLSQPSEHVVQVTVTLLVCVTNGIQLCLGWMHEQGIGNRTCLSSR